MASVYLSGRSWVARYVPIGGDRVKARRIPTTIAPADDSAASKRLALGWAAECERYCRIIEGSPLPDQIRHARELGVIESGDRVATATPVVEPTGPGLVSLVDAAQAHPSSRREPLTEQIRHQRCLNAFIAFAGITRLDELTIDQVMRYLDHLKTQGWSWDARRHALLWIRRASAMAPSYQQHDLLRGLHLDRRSQAETPTIDALTLTQLRAALIACTPTADQPDQRPRVALALGGLMGLRPSECFRLQVQDVDLVDAILHVGAREAKNVTSRRDLPLPPTLVTWLRPLTADRRPTDTLIACRTLTQLRPHAANPGRWTASTFTQWLGPLLRTASGTTVPAKALRKTFATWAVDRLPVAQLEAFLGHRFGGASAVTARHYLAKQAIEALRPAAALIEQALDIETLHEKRNTSHKS